MIEPISSIARLKAMHDDLRFAFRSLRRDREFTITAVVMLAVAIGLNVTVFAVMNTALFRGFPLVQENHRLLYMQERHPQGLCCLSYLDFEDWRAQAKSFEGMAFVRGRAITLSDDAGGRFVDTSASTITANAFALLGVQPMLGRDFVPADEAPGAPPVAILSHDFWGARFGNRPDVVGHTVLVDGAPATVIGVRPAGFHFPQRQNLWMPLVQTLELRQRGVGGGIAFGRLVDGATVEGARAELETINRRLAEQYPATNRGVVPRVETHSQFFIGPDAAMIYGSVWAAACFVLVIACANLANLTLARTLGRSREFSTRIALGGGRGRMARQIFTESVLVAGAAGVLGWWIARWSVLTWAAATESQYQILDYSLGYGTRGFAIAISFGVALLLALVQIARVARLDVHQTLKGEGRSATRGRRGKSVSATLVVGQVTLAFVLLAGAGVLVRSFWSVVGADAGVRAPENVLIGSVTVPSDEYPNPESWSAFFGSLRARLLEVPGVESASISTVRPVDNPRARPLEVEAHLSGGGDALGVPVLTAGTDYFRTVGAAMLAGREFNDRDRAAARLVAIVNRSFVDSFLPGEDPLGERIRFYDGADPGEWHTIVGVASNVMQGEPTRQRFVPLVYLSFQQAPWRGAWFFARTSAPPESVAAAVRTEVQGLHPDLTLVDFSTLKESFRFIAERMDLAHVEMGKHAAVAPIFAAIALLLAAFGLYAVVAHSVSQRTKEIGVRMAVGAAAGNIRRLIFREEMLPVVLGLALGLAVSLAVNRVLQSQLVGVSPFDPVTMAATPVVLVVVALLACHIPSRRAMRTDPMIALRHD